MQGDIVESIYLMRGRSGLYCYAPFGPDGPINSVEKAFDFSGRIYGKMADSDQIGDAIEIGRSLGLSDLALSVFGEFRIASTIRKKTIDVMSKDGKRNLAQFSWLVDFGEYDILDRELSDYDRTPNSQSVMSLRKAVVKITSLPPLDVWGSMYSSEFFVTSAVKKSLSAAQCSGFSFRKVEIVR